MGIGLLSKKAYKDAYQKAKILSEDELKDYSIILPIAQALDLRTFIKINVENLIAPTSQNIEWSKIKSKKIDYVLCDREMNTVAAIQIEDATDSITNILEACGILVLKYKKVEPEQFRTNLNNAITKQLLALSLNSIK